MDIKIIEKQYKVSPYNNLRYYLELTLSDYVDGLWQESYEEALHRGGVITTMRASGAPVVSNINFEENKITTTDFPEYATNEVPEFIRELEKYIALANVIYESKQERARQEKGLKEKQQQEQNKKLAELNKKLNS